MPTSPPDLATLHALLGHFARQLWDIQKAKGAMSNRVKAMERDGMAAQAAIARSIVAEFDTAEKAIDKHLERLVKRHPLAPWIGQARGIGLPGFARILGAVGPLDRFATVSKLWKFCGLHVTPDGRAARREKGVPWTHTDCVGGHLRSCKPACRTDHHSYCVPGGTGTAYSPQARVVCFQLAKFGIVMSGKGGPYREAYDRKKAYYEAERPDWTQARRHNAARRYAVKELLKDLWLAWRRLREVPS